MNTTREPLLAGQAVFEGTSLHILTDRALAKINRPYLSPSTAKSLHGCGAKLAADRLLPWGALDIFAATEKGSVTHRIFERMFNLDAKERTLNAALEMLDEVQASGPDDQDAKIRAEYVEKLSNPDAAKAWREEIAHNLATLFTLTDPTKLQVAGTEVRFDGIDVGGIPFKGFADLLLENPSGGLVIGDFKTGKVPNQRFGDPHGDQIRLYKTALESHPDFAGRKVSAGRLYYVTAGELVKPGVSKVACARTVKEFQEAKVILDEQANARAFETKRTGLCAWCPLVLACPVAKGANITPSERFLGAISEQDLFGGVEPVATPAPVVAQPKPAPEQTEGEKFLSDAYQRAAANTRPKPLAETKVCPTNTATAVKGTVTDESEGRDMKTWREVKAWDGIEVDGHLNTASWEVQAAFGLTSFAYKMLKQSQAQVTPRMIGSLAAIFHDIVSDTQARLTGGNTDEGLALNTRLRGLLCTIVEQDGVPLGEGPENWKAWANATARRVYALAEMSFALAAGDNPQLSTQSRPTPQEAFAALGAGNVG